MKRGFNHFTYEKRLKLEAMVKAGYSKPQMAEKLGYSLQTIYNELNRGMCELLNTDLTTRKEYSADIAETNARFAATAKGAPLKIGKNFEVADFIEQKIITEHYSPAAVCALLRDEENYARFKTTFCRQTVYKYIDDGNIFPHITNRDLPERGNRKREYKKIREKKQPRGRSIEDRPESVESRVEFGHWEMDTVVGSKGSRARLLVLTERVTRREIIIKIGTSAGVRRALNKLERKFGRRFKKIFKTITVDNGSEFADCAGMEKSCLAKESRVTIYYCHPYTASERGSNENLNRMIRRMFPKGTSFDAVTPAQVQKVEEWMNHYPRGILGYKSAESLFQEAIREVA